MPRCLMLAPFPLAHPRHGGQIRAASLAQGLARSGWQIDTVGLYHADFFAPGERGPLDIVIDDPALARHVSGDMLFGDLHVARAAAGDRAVVNQLASLLRRLQPDVVQVEHPWGWLVLQAALPSGQRPKIVYSSHNIERHARLPLLEFNLNLGHPGTDQLLEATSQLETDFARAADLTISISDIEGALIARETGRAVAYVPPTSDLAEGNHPAHATYRDAAHDSECRYAALMGSAYWPNVEGFFATFPDGLGFLAQDEQLWAAGSLGPALRSDARYRDYQSVNDSRLRTWGYLPDTDKASFFAGACCVIVPVHVGAGAKQKTADALASGLPVITTSHALEGYGPLIGDALGQGVYVADTPSAFRGFVRRALREGLRACPSAVRDRVSLARMAETLAPLYAGLPRGLPQAKITLV